MRKSGAVLAAAVIMGGSTAAWADGACPPGSCLEKIPFLLLALAAGYAVLVAAEKQRRPLALFGRFVAAVILLTSLTGLLCVAIFGVRCSSSGAAMCPFGGRGAACRTDGRVPSSASKGNTPQ